MESDNGVALITSWDVLCCASEDMTDNLTPCILINLSRKQSDSN